MDRPTLTIDPKVALTRLAYSEVEGARVEAVRTLLDHDLWTLQEYVRWLNRPQPGAIVFPLTDDLDHWAEIGVTKASELAAYLDGCFQREMMKELCY